LQLGLGPALVVLGYLTHLHELGEVAHLVSPHVPDRDPPLLGIAPSQPYELLAAFLGEFGDGEAYDLAVVLRVEAEVGLVYRPLDGAQRLGVERRDRQEPGSGTPTFATLLKGIFEP
jgi:hypothetical protein